MNPVKGSVNTNLVDGGAWLVEGGKKMVGTHRESLIRHIQQYRVNKQKAESDIAHLEKQIKSLKVYRDEMGHYINHLEARLKDV